MTRKLIFSTEFQKDFQKLEKPTQDRVRDLARKFRTDSLAGTHLERINGADSRLKTARVDRFYRAVVIAPESDNQFILHKVLPHDDAPVWIRRTRMDISQVDGTFDLWQAPQKPRKRAPATASPGAAPSLFHGIDDDTFASVGLDQEVISNARFIEFEDDLDSIRVSTPPSQWQVLADLADGATLDEVRQDIAERKAATDSKVAELEADADALEVAIARSVDQFHVVEDDADFKRILDYPFDTWLNYLDPAQSTLVDTDHEGPARITGGPGTGKTVVCVHRARRLAERADGFVLLTTYTKTLAAQMQRNVNLLVDDLEVRRRIKVQTLDRFARRVFDYAHPGELDGSFMRNPKNIWVKISHDLQLNVDASFLQEEFVEVVMAQQITSEEQYLTARRIGRGKPIGRAQRIQIWQAISRFNQYLVKNGKWTFETVLREAAQILGRETPKYRYLIVDEAQDLTPDHWRLIRAAVPKGKNHLFIAADSQQSIYKQQASLSSLGISVVGRSSHLTRNYRVAAEILRWATAVLDEEPSDLDEDERRRARNGTSAFHGFAPVTHGFESTDAELEYIAENVRIWINDMGNSPREIGVLARSNWLVRDISQRLKARGVDVTALDELDNPWVNGVAVGTMHSAKGLEFRCVAVAGVSAIDMPPARAVTPESEDRTTHLDDLKRERKLLYVACTRAREDLLITWTGDPSPFLDRAPGLRRS